MNSQIVECEGMVLRSLRYGETSRIVTLFTRAHGKVSAMAKGARETKSPFGSSLEPFCVASYVFYHRTGRDLQFLKSGWTEREYSALWEDAERFLHGAALLEFLDRILLEEEPVPEIYDLAQRALAVLTRAPRERLRELFRAFQLRAAAHLGYAPMLDRCLHCARGLPEGEAEMTEVWVFRATEGGALCPNCASGGEGGVRIRPRALRRIRTMALGRGEGFGEADLVGDRGGASLVRDSAAPSPLWIAALERIVEEYLHFHIERYHGLRSLRIRMDEMGAATA
ncbi:MAG: DNA repair protein RecO [Candidatus Eisenbacteria bacterium]|nr:DNA repair protein RecO [Candidatus Eisenbacteria bacterium]